MTSLWSKLIEKPIIPQREIDARPNMTAAQAEALEALYGHIAMVAKGDVNSCERAAALGDAQYRLLEADRQERDSA